MITKEIKIEGMSCMHCVNAVKLELSKLELESLEVKIGSAKIIYDESKTSIEKIDKAVEDAGFNICK